MSEGRIALACSTCGYMIFLTQAEYQEELNNYTEIVCRTCKRKSLGVLVDD